MEEELQWLPWLRGSELIIRRRFLTAGAAQRRNSQLLEAAWWGFLPALQRGDGILNGTSISSPNYENLPHLNCTENSTISTGLSQNAEKKLQAEM